MIVYWFVVQTKWLSIFMGVVKGFGSVLEKLDNLHGWRWVVDCKLAVCCSLVLVGGCRCCDWAGCDSFRLLMVYGFVCTSMRIWMGWFCLGKFIDCMRVLCCVQSLVEGCSCRA